LVVGDWSGLSASAEFLLARLRLKSLGLGELRRKGWVVAVAVSARVVALDWASAGRASVGARNAAARRVGREDGAWAWRVPLDARLDRREGGLVRVLAGFFYEMGGL
jgi:hypothetical protein